MHPCVWAMPTSAVTVGACETSRVRRWLTRARMAEASASTDAAARISLRTRLIVTAADMPWPATSPIAKSTRPEPRSNASYQSPPTRSSSPAEAYVELNATEGTAGRARCRKARCSVSTTRRSALKAARRSRSRISISSRSRRARSNRRHAWAVLSAKKKPIPKLSSAETTINAPSSASSRPDSSSRRSFRRSSSASTTCQSLRNRSTNLLPAFCIVSVLDSGLRSEGAATDVTQAEFMLAASASAFCARAKRSWAKRSFNAANVPGSA